VVAQEGHPRAVQANRHRAKNLGSGGRDSQESTLKCRCELDVVKCLHSSRKSLESVDHKNTEKDGSKEKGSFLMGEEKTGVRRKLSQSSWTQGRLYRMQWSLHADAREAERRLKGTSGCEKNGFKGRKRPAAEVCSYLGEKVHGSGSRKTSGCRPRSGQWCKLGGKNTHIEI